MFSVLLAAVLVANPIIERGEPARLSPQIEFAQGEQLRSYSFFAYAHGLPAAFVKINADKVKLTGNKAEHKSYWRYSGWLGGLKTESFKEAMEKHPERVIEHAVKGMLPHNTLGRKQGMKLKVYAGPEHPHAAQNPVKIDLEA